MEPTPDLNLDFERAKVRQASQGWPFPRRSVTREQVEKSRRMSVEERLLAGPRLFNEASASMTAGLRILLPHAYEEELMVVLSRVLRAVESHESEVWGEGGTFEPLNELREEVRNSGLI